MDSLDYLLTENPVIWVFGYGSLLWKPDFSYKSKLVGYIDGYIRRFNQGNETFRGIPGKPGRVANLEECPGSKTWGVAYEISGRRDVAKVLQDLYIREARCGGYDTMVTTFYPREFARDGHQHQPEASSSSSPSSSSSSSSSSPPSSPDEMISRQLQHRSSLPSEASIVAPKLRRFSQAVSSNSSSNHTRTQSSAGNFASDPTKTTDIDIDHIDHIDLDESSQMNSERSTSYNSNSDSESNSESNSKSDSKSDSVSSNAPSVQQVLSKSNDVINDNNDVESSSPASSTADFSASTTTNTSTAHAHACHASAHIPVPVQVLLYTATANNALYLGGDSLSNLAHQIVDSSGTAGTNVEYVLKIAEHNRKFIPEDDDEYLFALDAKVREELYRRINTQRSVVAGSKGVERDADLEKHEALLKTISIRAS